LLQSILPYSKLRPTMDPTGANLLFSLLSGLAEGGPPPGRGGGGGRGEEDDDSGPRDAVTCPVCLKAHLPRGGPTDAAAAAAAATSPGPTPSSGAIGGSQNANADSTSTGAEAVATAAAATGGGKDYGALQVYVQSKCPICLEESGPPVVALPCGHCVCRDDYFRMGGSFLDEANPRDRVLPPAAAAASGDNATAGGAESGSPSAGAGRVGSRSGRSTSSNGINGRPRNDAGTSNASSTSSPSGPTTRTSTGDGRGSHSARGSADRSSSSRGGAGSGGGGSSSGTGRRRRHNRWTNDEEEVSDDDDMDGLPVDFRDFLMDAIARQVMMGGGGDDDDDGGPPMPFPFAMMGGGPPFGPPPFGPPLGPPLHYDDSDDDDDDDDSMPPLESRDGNSSNNNGGSDDDDDDSSMPPLEDIAPVASGRIRDLSEVESADDSDNGRRGDNDDSSHDSMPPLEDKGVSSDDEDDDEDDYTDSDDDDDDDDMPPLEPLNAPSAATDNQQQQQQQQQQEGKGDEDDDDDDDDDMPSLEPLLPSINILVRRSPPSTAAASGNTATAAAATADAAATTTTTPSRTTGGDEDDRRRRGVRRQRCAIGATTFALGAHTEEEETKAKTPIQSQTETRQTSAPAANGTIRGSEQETERRQGKRRRGRDSRHSDSEGRNGGDDSVDADTALAASNPSGGNKKEETKKKTESCESANMSSSRNGGRNKKQQGRDQEQEQQQSQPKKISVGAKDGRDDAAAAAAIVPAPPVEGAEGGLWLLAAGESDEENIKLWHTNLDGTVTRAAIVPAMSTLIPDGRGGAFVHSPMPARADEDDKKRGSLRHISNGKGTLENYRLLHKDAQVVTDGKGGIWALYPSKDSEVMVLVSAKKWSKIRSGQRTIGTFSIASSLVASDDKGGVYVNVEAEGVKASGDSAESENPDTVNEVGLWRVDHRGSKVLVPPKETDTCMVDGRGNVWCLTKGNRSKKRKLLCLSHSSKKKDETTSIEPVLFVRQPLLICGGKNGGVFVHAPGEDKYSSWSLKYVTRDGSSLKCISLGDCPRSARIIGDGGDGVWIIKKSRTKGGFPSLSHMSPSKPCELVCELPFMPEDMSTVTS